MESLADSKVCHREYYSTEFTWQSLFSISFLSFLFYCMNHNPSVQRIPGELAEILRTVDMVELNSTLFFFLFFRFIFDIYVSDCQLRLCSRCRFLLDIVGPFRGNIFSIFYRQF